MEFHGRSSLAWSHFTIDEGSKKAICKYCNRPICFHGKTSNLIKHMNRKHQEIMVVKKEIQQEDINKSIETMVDEEFIPDDSNCESLVELSQEHDINNHYLVAERIIFINIETACRICLSDALLESVFIQDKSVLSHSNTVTYQEMLKDCTGIDLSEDEPQKICCECAKKLREAYELKMQCIETQKILKNCATSKENKSESLIIEEIELKNRIEIEEFLIEGNEPLTVLSVPLSEKDYAPQNYKEKPLKRHQICTDEKPFECDICGVRTTSKTGIAIHIKTQHLNIHLQCKYCNSQYRSRIILNSHIRRVHPEQKSPLKCEYCDYTTPNFPNLFRHRRTHTQKYLHKCGICEKEFVTKHNLKTHAASHSDDRPFSCIECNSSFKTRKTLGVHMKSHRDPEYECLVCGRGFRTNQLMRNHVVRLHPDAELPPPGTILNKTWRIKKATQELRDNVVRLGYDPGVVKSVIIDESYLKSAKKYVRKNKIEKIGK